MLRLTILFVVAALFCCACSSDPVARQPQRGDASPEIFDFTKQDEPKDGEPVDPATCKHVWVPTQTHPYQTVVNGMPMTRMCFVQRCNRCNKVRHECTRALEQQRRARARGRTR